MKIAKIAAAILTAVLAVVSSIGAVTRWTQGRPLAEIVPNLFVAGVCTLLTIVLFCLAFQKGPLAKKWAMLIGPRQALSNLLEGARRPEGMLPGDVAVVYHTYAGFLVYGVQSEWRFALPAGDARTVLRKMLRSNLTWGMLAPGLVFVPLLALGNYWTQLRSIRQQEIAAVERTSFS